MDDLEVIKQKINVVDLIQEYLPLKKSGVNFKANCPFHQEKTPSFMVSPERQIWKCFGCGKSGDIFTFLIEKEGMEFKEALEFLAKKAGVVLKRQVKKDSRDRLYEANLKAQEFFHFILTKHKFGKKALLYLKGRGITDLSIEQFGIGYAPSSWESLTKFLLKRGFTTEQLINNGLSIASKLSSYDRFRGRIIFPLIDTKDKIIGFSGRVLDGSEPKYINTPQTPIFDKGSFLYGINRSKGEIRTKNEVILVEGEMDVILSFQAGIRNVSAVKGSSLTAKQVELLKRYTQNITLCFDTDIAGDAAARRGIEIADMAGFNIKVIRLEGGKDPAEIIKTNPNTWEKATTSSVPIYDYYLTSVATRFDPQDPKGLRQIASELIPIWAKITDDLVREHYIQKLGALIRSPEGILRQAINKERSNPKTNFSKVFQELVSNGVAKSASRQELLEEYLLALLLHIPKDHLYVPSFPETLFIKEQLRQIFVLLVLYLDSISFKGRSFIINEFVRDVPSELLDEIDRLYLVELDAKMADKNIWQKEVDKVKLELKKCLVKASLEKLSLEIKNAQEFGKMEIVEGLNRRFSDLSVKLKNL